MKLDIAPDSCTVNHNERSSSRGGGLAFVFRNGLDLKIVRAPGPKPTAFEVQVAELVKSLHKICLVNIYRRPGNGVAEFFDQNAILLDNLVDASGRLCMGNFNCPGKIADTVDSSLETLLSCYGLTASPAVH
jgi:hypothetical protein